jgi:GNAT superfamily N-acetyltransferase
MHSFRNEPSIAATDSFFIQRVTLNTTELGDVGTCVWYAQSDLEGVMRILRITIADEHRRKGMGSLLFKHSVAQARELFKTRGGKLRRVIIDMEQKTQVIGRAFLTRHGFHHVSTISHVLHRQDIMVYQLSLT